MEGSSQPPMSWRYCGNQLKMWRTQAGVTREELAKEANYEFESIKSMEQGRRKPTLRVLEVADQMFGARGLLIAANEYLKPEKFASYSQDFMRYEAEAIVVNWFEALIIPGLLQTEAYAWELIGDHCPPLDDETIEARVAARLERQALLEKQTRAFTFVIGETGVRFPIGSKETHVRQLQHLLHVGKRRNVTVQVVRFGGSHPGLLGPFVLLETPDHEHLAYEEGQTTGVLYADPAKVSVVTQRHAMILRAALSPEESVKFIGELAEEL
ncbi:helix-turn-helix transcriptional regulator [Streptomyces sp. NA02950]|uniref:helix-turn-helix domain-containing protein n=1 Tax=Streptomyces sp. NA02950 TaxID=2742137 RepID=UPI0020CAB511|nr:helix-turn-helix transcriptional regulator [Streptomyces sp. NA02950]